MQHEIKTGPAVDLGTRITLDGRAVPIKRRGIKVELGKTYETTWDDLGRIVHHREVEPGEE